MSENIHDEDVFLKDLGLTKGRMYELIRIVKHTMLQEGQCGMTSHVLLTIAGRKDLNDLEKTICSFIFSTTAFKNSNIKEIVAKESDKENVEEHVDKKNVDENDKEKSGISNSINIGLIESKNVTELQGINSLGLSDELLIGFPGIDKEELMEILMASLISLAKQLPKDDAIKFFRRSSIKLAKISVTL